MHDSKEIALALEEIAALLAFSGEGRFKARAYEQGARVVAGLGEELRVAIEADRLMEIEGIGRALSSQIKELWEEGESKLLLRLRSEHPPGAAELAQLKGMTPRRIRALHAALGISSVPELRDACQAGLVRGVPSFGPKTEQRLAAESERWLNRSEGERRILLSHAHALAATLQRRLLHLDSVRSVELAGEARRGLETVGALELVLVLDASPDDVFAQLERFPEVVRVEREQSLAQLAEGIPLHLHFSDAQQHGARLLHATGSAAHVRALATLAATQHHTLLSDALTHAHGAVAAQQTEASIYHALGLAYVPPELRVGATELDAAEQPTFAGLLSASDIQGAVHCHTTYSDGKNSIEEMARAAQELGLHYITITDHSQSATYAGGLTIDRLKQQWDEIDEVQQRVQIRILKGAECDILADGSLDFPDDVLAQLDVVIASIHQRFQMSREAMTGRLVRAMSWPVFKIWGHALGRLLLHREPIDCAVPEVLDALAASRGAVELNADPHRLDLTPEWIPAARERGIPFVVSVDAHSTRGLNVLPYGVTMARRGRVRAAEVLNTLSSEAFFARVRPV